MSDIKNIDLIDMDVIQLDASNENISSSVIATAITTTTTTATAASTVILTDFESNQKLELQELSHIKNDDNKSDSSIKLNVLMDSRNNTYSDKNCKMKLETIDDNVEFNMKLDTIKEKKFNDNLDCGDIIDEACSLSSKLNDENNETMIDNDDICFIKNSESKLGKNEEAIHNLTCSGSNDAARPLSINSNDYSNYKYNQTMKLFNRNMKFGTRNLEEVEEFDDNLVCSNENGQSTPAFNLSYYLHFNDKNTVNDADGSCSNENCDKQFKTNKESVKNSNYNNNNDSSHSDYLKYEYDQTMVNNEEDCRDVNCGMKFETMEEEFDNLDCNNDSGQSTPVFNLSYYLHFKDKNTGNDADGNCFNGNCDKKFETNKESMNNLHYSNRNSSSHSFSNNRNDYSNYEDDELMIDTDDSCFNEKCEMKFETNEEPLDNLNCGSNSCQQNPFLRNSKYLIFKSNETMKRNSNVDNDMTKNNVKDSKLEDMKTVKVKPSSGFNGDTTEKLNDEHTPLFGTSSKIIDDVDVGSPENYINADIDLATDLIKAISSSDSESESEDEIENNSESNSENESSECSENFQYFVFNAENKLEIKKKEIYHTDKLRRLSSLRKHNVKEFKVNKGKIKYDSNKCARASCYLTPKNDILKSKSISNIPMKIEETVAKSRMDKVIPPPLISNPDIDIIHYFIRNNIRFPIRRPSSARQPRKGEAVYCYCRSPYDEVAEMILCDGDSCLIEWFHCECLNMNIAPKQKWLCAECKLEEKRNFKSLEK